MFEKYTGIKSAVYFKISRTGTRLGRARDRNSHRVFAVLKLDKCIKHWNQEFSTVDLLASIDSHSVDKYINFKE